MHDLCTSLKDSASLCLGCCNKAPCMRQLVEHLFTAVFPEVGSSRSSKAKIQDRHLLEVSRAGSFRGLGGKELLEASLLAF